MLPTTTVSFELLAEGDVEDACLANICLTTWQVTHQYSASYIMGKQSHSVEKENLYHKWEGKSSLAGSLEQVVLVFQLSSARIKREITSAP